MSKNGGPYTKSQQEKRRKKVYEMHFEKSKSASYIADELGVNRHTIEEDIKYWYSELAAKFEKMDVQELFARQCERMEVQRDRLVSLLEKQQDISVILKIEKMIFELDRAITKMIPPIIQNKKDEISDEEAISTVQHLVVSDQYGRTTIYSDKELLRDIIQYKNCDIVYAEKILDKIRSLGLELYKDDGFLVNATKYDLLGFAESRNIIPDDKLKQVYSKIEELHKEQKQEIAELEQEDAERESKAMQEFTAKYGDKSNWNEWVWRDYYREIGFG